MNPKRFLLMGVAVLLAGVSAIAVVPARAEEPFCFECHDDFPKKMKAFKSTHDPVAGGECTACHLDHKDKEKLMLVKEAPALCYDCHDNMAVGKSIHPPVAEGKCLDCHNPHGSANRKLLVADGRALCDKCHASSQEFARPVAHAALDEGCNACHRPHASENPRLLTKNLVMDRLARFEPGQAELCFGCHDAETFTKAKTEDTGFRMGTANLHTLHLNGGTRIPDKYGIVKKKDGQTCFACHLPHTAMQQKLLRTEYQCIGGTFCFTMRFTPNTDGGTCVVGCHKPRVYSRVAPDPDAAAEVTPGEQKVVQ